MVRTDALAAGWVASRSWSRLRWIPREENPIALWTATTRRLRAWGLHHEEIRRILQLRRECPLDDLITTVEECGVEVAAYEGRNYPQQLVQLPLRPPCLLLKGPDSVWKRILAAPRIALVGTRRASPYGLEVAREFARHLARAGVAVVSGMAKGIDAAAHLGALEAGGLSVAVLGSGPDVVYPAANRSLYERLCAEGAVASQFPPGFPPARWTFPLRNWVIAALADAVLLVEAGLSSGALVTVSAAIDLGRPVFVVPGPVVGANHMGGLALLADGAYVAAKPEWLLQDFFYHARSLLEDRLPDPEQDRSAAGGAGDGVFDGQPAWDRSDLRRTPGPNRRAVEDGASGDDEGSREVQTDAALLPASLKERRRLKELKAPREPKEPGGGSGSGGGAEDPVARLVLTALSGGPLCVDELAQAAGCTSREAAVALGRLELAGRIRRRGPGRYEQVG